MSETSGASLPSLCVPYDEAREKIEDRIRSGVELLGQLEKFANAPILPDTELYQNDIEELRYRWISWHKTNHTLLRRLFSSSEVGDHYSNNTAVPPPSPSTALKDSIGTPLKLV
jgi:hypothetical protein